MKPAQRALQKKFEDAAALKGTQRYSLCLYIAGHTARSQRAIDNLTRICRRHLPGRVDLEVVDIYQQTESNLNDARVIAAPMLVKQLPLPLRRLIGDLSDERKVLLSLDLSALEGPPSGQPE
ncbi:MAG: circadian clock KaiB family protein [Planctomycetota bacterium]|nr:circadian clock KaiB family protein [Planctomycetota bacterium]